MLKFIAGLIVGLIIGVVGLMYFLARSLGD